MSIPVDLAALGEALERHDTAYLLTSGGARPHVAEVFPRLVDGVVVIAEPGRTARQVVAQQPTLTILLPPREAAGYTLIIDGDGSVDDAGALHVTPSHAVLHRAAGHGGHTEHDSDCGNDCRPISG